MLKILQPFFVFIILIFLTSCSSETETQSESQSEAASAGLLIEGEEPEIIAGPLDFTEGPYWHPDRYLLFSDIPANRVYKWTETEGLEVFLEPSGNSNGIEAHTDGSILLAQHAGRVSKVEENKEVTVLADSYEGKRLNSPNDIAVHSNGDIFFTDPPFGVSSEERELDFSGVFKLTPGGELTVVYDQFEYPNGIAFNADETKLYVDDSGTGNIIVFDMDNEGNPHLPELFANVGAMGSGMGAADGMVTDMEGHLYVTGPKGITIFDENGYQLHLITFDEQVTNLEWGGEESDHLFITGNNNVYRYRMNATGKKKR